MFYFLKIFIFLFVLTLGGCNKNLTEEEKKEKQILQTCFQQIEKINGWMGFIVGRIGQFLMG